MIRAMVAWALVGSSVVACSAKPAEAEKTKKGGQKSLVFAADVIPVEAKKVDYVVTAPGLIDAFERVQVTARVAGAVDRVAFREGQEIKKGQVLVVIDSERFQLAVNSAKAARAKALAAQQDTEAMVTRREGASDAHPGLIPGEELASYRTKSLTAKADTEVANEALKGAELNLRDSSVRAPMDGVVQTRTVETGQYVQAGYIMATLLRKDPMLLRFSVQPSEAPRIKPGMTATFTMRETQRTYSARISLVSGAGDDQTHMVPVTAELTEDDHKYWLRPGSFCDVTITLPVDRTAPVVPRLAVRATDHGYVAYVADGDTAKEHVVTLGMSTKDGFVEVRSGLAAGELLVVRGGEALSDGAKLKVNRTNVDSLMGGDAGAAADATPTPPSPASGEHPKKHGAAEAGAP